MIATLVGTERQDDGLFKQVPGCSLIGQYVSSLHLSTDEFDEDGAFFVFGDISCREKGQYRLSFSLYDYAKDNSEASFIGNVVSEPLSVVTWKEYARVLEPSTNLTQALAEQGVRLRLRKTPRRTLRSQQSSGGSPPKFPSPELDDSIYCAQPRAQDLVDEEPATKRPRFDSGWQEYDHMTPGVPSGSGSHYSNDLRSIGNSRPSIEPQHSVQSYGYPILWPFHPHEIAAHDIYGPEILATPASF
ncbi:hypothetical protein LTR37_005338 [Vermiconidia calcicola]|uniref:Uncharacterized protein n=1 Tax=Vermiconidia calcicola TaxID=1690605 RepID=A0ACC3NK64_9PEZI|nr:hypothetical protein LTR37_005338 [Vermiconidia calcicola]